MATSVCSSKSGGREILHRMAATVIRPQSLHIPLITSFSSCTFVSRHSHHHHYHSQHISFPDLATVSPPIRNGSSPLSQISTHTATTPSSTTMTTVDAKNTVSCNCNCSGSSKNSFPLLTPASSFSSSYYYYYPYHSIHSYFCRAPSVCHSLVSSSSSRSSSFLPYYLPTLSFFSSCTTTTGGTSSHAIAGTSSSSSRSKMRNTWSRKHHWRASSLGIRRWYSMKDRSSTEWNEDGALLLLGVPATSSLHSLQEVLGAGGEIKQHQSLPLPPPRGGEGDDGRVRLMGSARWCSRHDNPLLHACRFFRDNAAAVGGGGSSALEKEEQGKGGNEGEEQKRGARVLDSEEERNKKTDGGNGNLDDPATSLRPDTSYFSPPPPPGYSSPPYRVVTITEKKRLSGERVGFFIHCDPYFSNEAASESSSISPAEDLQGPPASLASPLLDKEAPLPSGEGWTPSATSISSTPSPSSGAFSSSVEMPSTAVGESGGSAEKANPSRYYPPCHHHHHHHHPQHPLMPSPSPYTPHAGTTAPSASPFPLSRPALTPSPAMLEPVKRVLLLRCGMHAAQEDKKSLIHSQDWRIPLLPEGKESSREMGRNISELVGDDPVYIYHSPYTRAREAMEEVIKGLKDGRKAREEWNREKQEVVGEEVREGKQPERGGKGQNADTLNTTSSPCSSTSSLLASSFSFSPIIGVREDARLRGGDMGRYDHVEEMTYHLAQCEKYGPFFYRFPHGESGADVCDRITSFIGSFQRERLDLAPNTNVLLVTHDIVIRMFLKRWFHLNVETFHQMRSIPPSSLITMTRVHHQSSFRLNEECVEMLGLPLSLNEHNGYRYRNKNFLGSMSSGAPFM